MAFLKYLLQDFSFKPKYILIKPNLAIVLVIEFQLFSVLPLAVQRTKFKTISWWLISFLQREIIKKVSKQDYL